MSSDKNHPVVLLSESKHGVGASLLTKNELGSIPSRTASFISVKCYQVAWSVWGGAVKVQILLRRPKFWGDSDRGLHVALAMRRLGIVTPSLHQDYTVEST